MAVIHFAPLQGYTDAIYREEHARVFGGVDCYYTPFVRIEKDTFRNKDLRDLAPTEGGWAVVVPQMIAATPEEFRRLAQLFLESGYREVDINLGCPFPKQAKAHRGAGLLPYPAEAEALLRMVEAFPDLSFSVKMRLGWSDPAEAFVLLPLLNRLPLRHITLHPRLGIQQYKGMVDRNLFARFYEECEHPLFYNGDLTRLEEMDALLERFPRLAGLMLGRGLLAAPWLAREHQSGSLLSEADRRARSLAFHEGLLARYQARLEGGEHQLLEKMKTLWDYFWPDANKKLRKHVLKAHSLSAYQAAVQALLCP